MFNNVFGEGLALSSKIESPRFNTMHLQAGQRKLAVWTPGELLPASVYNMGLDECLTVFKAVPLVLL